jgi:hypothetical protein
MLILQNAAREFGGRRCLEVKNIDRFWQTFKLLMKKRKQLNSVTIYRLPTEHEQVEFISYLKPSELLTRLSGWNSYVGVARAHEV